MYTARELPCSDLTVVCTQRPSSCQNVQPPALGLEKFEVERPIPPPAPEDPSASVDPPHSPSSASSRVKWDSYFDAQAARIGLQSPSKACDVPTFKVPRALRGVTKYRPRFFVVNPRDAEEVSLREAPRSDSAEVCMARGMLLRGSAENPLRCMRPYVRTTPGC